jgi:hypothetical protein
MTIRTTAAAPFALAALLLAGCGTSNTMGFGQVNSPFAASAFATRHQTAAPSQAGPQSEAQFVQAVAALGVQLQPADLTVLSKERAMVPNGQWAERPAANLTAAQNLQVHFLKHGSQFHPAPASPQAYLAQAIATAEGQRGTVSYLYDITSNAKGYQTHILRYVAASHELTCVRPTDGAITTYYIDNGLAPNRFVPIPAF